MNITINGGTNSFEGITGLEQEIIDALKDQAEKTCSNHYFNHDAILFGKYEHERGMVPNYVTDHWQDYLTPKASAMIGKMQELINNQP